MESAAVFHVSAGVCGFGPVRHARRGRGRLEQALRAAFEYDGPAVVDVRVSRQELSLPPKLTFGQIKGFTLYATRTVLSGDADELIDLAKTNLHELDME